MLQMVKVDHSGDQMKLISNCNLSVFYNFINNRYVNFKVRLSNNHVVSTLGVLGVLGVGIVLFNYLKNPKIGVFPTQIVNTYHTICKGGHTIQNEVVQVYSYLHV